MAQSSPIDFCSSPDSASYNLITIDGVLETSPIGTIIKNFTFNGSNDQIELLLNSTMFSILTQTRQLIIKKKLTVVFTNPMITTDTLYCRIKSNNQNIIYILVINIYDENDNAPIFQNIPYSVNVSEDTSFGTTIFKGIVATDADPSDSNLNYSISNFNDYFTLSRGNLILTKQLNYDITPLLFLNISVKDNIYNLTILNKSQPQHVIYTTVNISIIPVTDDNPIFSRNMYTTILQYNANTGQELAFNSPIIASTVKNKQLTYNIVMDPYNDDWNSFNMSYFSKPSVILAKPLKKYAYLFEIHAKIVGSRYRVGFTVLQVIVTWPLEFTTKSFAFSLFEDCSIGTVFGCLNVTSAQNSNLEFSVQSNLLIFSNYFFLNKKTGVLSTIKPLLGINKSNLIFNIEVSDRSTAQSDTSTMIFRIIQTNFSNFKFTKSIYSFAPNSIPVIGRVQVENIDSNLISYHLIDPTNLFLIDNNGTIFFNSVNNVLLNTCLAVIAKSLTLEYGSDTALVIITYQQPIGDSVSMDVQKYQISLIVIAIVAGCLLLIIIAMILYLCYRKKINNKDEKSIVPIIKEHNSKVVKFLNESGEMSTYFNGTDTMNTTIMSEYDPRSLGTNKREKNNEILKANSRDEKSILVGMLTSNISISDRATRLPDYTSSQETVSASNMTLTRPQMGANGITVYY